MARQLSIYLQFATIHTAAYDASRGACASLPTNKGTFGFITLALGVLTKEMSSRLRTGPTNQVPVDLGFCSWENMVGREESLLRIESSPQHLHTSGYLGLSGCPQNLVTPNEPMRWIRECHVVGNDRLSDTLAHSRSVSKDATNQITGCGMMGRVALSSRFNRHRNSPDEVIPNKGIKFQTRRPALGA